MPCAYWEVLRENEETKREALSPGLGISQSHISYFKVDGNSGTTFPFTMEFIKSRWTTTLKLERTMIFSLHTEEKEEKLETRGERVNRPYHN